MNAVERAARVRLMILDVDGVLTDGSLYYGPGGEVMKAFNVRDGHGVKLLREGGVEVAILTARQSEIVAVRARELGVNRVLQGAADKVAGFERLAGDAGIAAESCGYIGDDWPDLAVLTRVGFAATVADAAPEVRAAAHWVTAAPGGRGAVRELAEFVLQAQGRFAPLLARHGGGSYA
jgi:3-deoxy-D-manno-octulosonate 8-phosphate phosphatase (KDO 8-P phosphatase)